MENKMSCPNCERYRKALERIAVFGIDTGMDKADIASAALAPTPEELGEQPLPFEGAPV